MRRVVLLAGLLTTTVGREGRADCVAAPPRAVTIEVDYCDMKASDDKGLILVGTPTDDGKVLRVWVAAVEKVRCSNLEGGGVVRGNLETSCCGDRKPACSRGADATLSKVTVLSPRAVEQMTRAELAAEVQKLRVENGRLRRELGSVLRRLREEIEDLLQEHRKLSTKLGD